MKGWHGAAGNVDASQLWDSLFDTELGFYCLCGALHVLPMFA